MRPPKPRITKPSLCWKWNWRRERWDPYYRVTWTDAGKRRERMIIINWDGDPERLDTVYWEIRSNKHEATRPKPPTHTWRALIEAWRSDPRIAKRLAPSTRKAYRRPMDAIMEKNGDKAVASTTRQGLRKAHDALSDTPRKADWYVQIVSLLWNYGKLKRDWPLGDNPATGIELFGAQSPFEPWPAWMVGKLKDAPVNVQTAAELIMGTGQRPNAAIGMRWADFSGDAMTVLDEKSGERFETYCPEDLRQYMKGIEKRGAHVLAKNLTTPLGYDGIEKPFRRWRNNLGEEAKPYSLHGLRKLAIIRLAEAGCSDAEIQAVTNQSPETVAYYRKKADRTKLSRAAQQRRK